MVNKVTFARFRGAIAPIYPTGSAPWLTRESSRIDSKDSEPKAQVRLPYTLQAGVRYIHTWLYRYAAGMVLRMTPERARCCLKRLCWENHAR